MVAQYANGTIKYSQNSRDALGVAKYYITDQINVFAKGGISYIRQTLSQSFANVNNQALAQSLTGISKTEGKVKPKVAAGLGYNLTNNIELTAEYSHTFGDKVSQSGDLLGGSNNQEQLLVDANKIPSNNEVLVGMNYYF